MNFVPRESGLHYVHVKLNGVHVPGSPYPVQVGRLDADASQVTAYGDGLYKGFTGTCLRVVVLHVSSLLYETVQVPSCCTARLIV